MLLSKCKSSIIHVLKGNTFIERIKAPPAGHAPSMQSLPKADLTAWKAASTPAICPAYSCRDPVVSSITNRVTGRTAFATILCTVSQIPRRTPGLFLQPPVGMLEDGETHRVYICGTDS